MNPDLMILCVTAIIIAVMIILYLTICRLAAIIEETTGSTAKYILNIEKVAMASMSLLSEKDTDATRFFGVAGQYGQEVNIPEPQVEIPPKKNTTTFKMGN